MLLEKYSRDVAFVLGIPPNFVVSKSNMTGSSSSAQQGENTHTFTTNAQSICRHLERLLSDVHEVIYGDAAEFSIVPMPRVTIETMEVIYVSIMCKFMLFHALSCSFMLILTFMDRTSRASWRLG